MKRNLFIALCGLILTACSSTPDPTLLDLMLTASADLNPDLTNRPSPMVIKLVELKSHTAFENADYFALSANTKSVLGPDYVAEEMMPVRPGEIKKFKLRLHPESRFIGVLAEYRALDKAVWRYVIQPKKEDFSDIRLELTKDAIRPLNAAKYNDKNESDVTINASQAQQAISTLPNANTAAGVNSATPVQASMISTKPSFNLDITE
ncbi:MAG: type VI secretion system lipoprotein TssJ [Tolumonas sp.]|nr:type VI secretion system lipoprotein TssJ [Tolumonas sp.]